MKAIAWQRTRMVLPFFFVLLAGCKVYTTDGPSVDPDADKQFVCHAGSKTMRLADNAVRDHLNHGDRLGRCE